MSETSTKKIIVSLCVLAVLGYVIYALFFIPAPASATVPGQDVLFMTEKLKTISGDTKLFSSPLYTNLQDFGAPLQPQVQGRDNPFGLIDQSQSMTVKTSR